MKPESGEKSVKTTILSLAVTAAFAAPAQAAFLAPGSTGTIAAMGGCFKFAECLISENNISDNNTTVTTTEGTFGTGIAGDGLIAIWNFAVGGDGNSLTITSWSQDS